MDLTGGVAQAVEHLLCKHKYQSHQKTNEKQAVSWIWPSGQSLLATPDQEFNVSQYTFKSFLSKFLVS
jgi:hypothetical protein